MSTLVKGEPWVEDRAGDVLEGAWVATGAPAATRPGKSGRLLQAEETGTLAGAVLDVIASAREVVMVSSFLVADAATEKALLDAAKTRGVRVYLLVASEARLEREVRDDDVFGQRVFAEHCDLLDRLAGWVCVRTAEHFHAKIVLADPKTEPRGLLLTSNLTTDALRRNHELALELRADEVRGLAALFGWAFWESAQRELLEARRLRPVTAPARLSLPQASGVIVATAGTRRDLRNTALELIGGARRRLVLATFGIGERAIIDALCERAAANVQVTLLVRHPRGAMLPVLRELSRGGVHVAGVSKFLHAKAIVADGDRGLLMTANLEKHGLEEGFELGVRLGPDDTAALERLLAAWEAGAGFLLRDTVRIGDLRGPVQILNGKGYKDLMIEPVHEVDAGTVNVDCCTKLESAKRPTAPRPPEGRLFHRIEHTWTIRPPVLARGAKPVPPPAAAEDGKETQDGAKASLPAPPFPIYQEPAGRRVFTVGSLSEVPSARAAMKAFDVAAVVLSER